MITLKKGVAFTIFCVASVALWNERSPTISQNATSHDDIVVAAYNVENLFDLVKSGLEYDIYEPNTHNWTPSTYAVKLHNIAQVIADINASIIALEEIESPLALSQLRATLQKKGISYPYFALTTGEANVKQALLSTYPIISQRTIMPLYRSAHTRGILEACVNINDHLVYFYVNHWRSKKGSEEERIATASLLMKELESKASKEYILLGDFNSNYDEYKTSSHKTAINHELHTLSEKGTLLTTHELEEGEKGHTNLWLELPHEERYSTKFAGKNGSIDAIILPATLFDGHDIDYVNHSFHTFKPPYLLQNGQPKRWKISQQGKGEHKAQGYSDHLPVVAHFSFSPFSHTILHPPQQTHRTLEDLLILPDGMVNTLISHAVVTYTSETMAIIKDSSGHSFPLNDPLGLLKEGHCVDLLIKRKSTIENKKFGWDISLQHEYGFDHSYQHLWHQSPVLPLHSTLLAWEVIKQTPVVYSQGRIVYHNESIPVTFGSKSFKPANKTKLMIHRGLIEFTDRQRLRVEHQEDFTIIP